MVAHRVEHTELPLQANTVALREGMEPLHQDPQVNTADPLLGLLVTDNKAAMDSSKAVMANRAATELLQLHQDTRMLALDSLSYPEAVLLLESGSHPFTKVMAEISLSQNPNNKPCSCSDLLNHLSVPSLYCDCRHSFSRSNSAFLITLSETSSIGGVLLGGARGMRYTQSRFWIQGDKTDNDLTSCDGHPVVALPLLDVLRSLSKGDRQ